MRTLVPAVCFFWLTALGAGCSSDTPDPGDPDADVPTEDGGMSSDGMPTPDASPPDAAPVSDTPIDDCLRAMFSEPESVIGPDYDQFGVPVGSHCVGTDQQDIVGVERVVFLGDSVTVGTPPTQSSDYYRSIVADALVDRFGLDAPNGLWRSVNPIDGTSAVRDSGDFSSCAEWGARTDDFMAGGSQIADCFPAGELDKRTLVIITMGGNDIAAIAKDGIDNTPIGVLMADAQQFVDYMRAAVEWLQTPGRFPNGVYVVFANVYEYTDGTAELGSCPGATLAGFDGEWADPQQLIDLMLWINEQYMAIAADTGTDMLFMQETFCGHGYNADDPDSPCYRGAGSDNWFDATCIHPTPGGHQALADMFLAIVDE